MQDLFKGSKVLKKPLAAFIREEHGRARFDTYKRFFDMDGAGFFQSFEVSAQVAVREIARLFEVVKREAIDRTGQCRHNGEAVRLVEYGF